MKRQRKLHRQARQAFGQWLAASRAWVRLNREGSDGEGGAEGNEDREARAVVQRIDQAAEAFEKALRQLNDGHLGPFMVSSGELNIGDERAHRRTVRANHFTSGHA